MRIRLSASLLAFLAVCGLGLDGGAFAAEEGQSAKPRLLVLTDIGGDPDDQQSLIRLMHYANEFEIEGLIASAAGTRGELKEATTKPELIREIVEAYGKVQPKLAKHAEGYPSAEDLLSKTKSGNPQRGWEFVGAGHDTEGSKLIVERADAEDERPLNIVIWGGQTDLAQALWRIKEDRGAEGLRAFASKVRIYDINDQDAIADRIWKEFPGLFYVLASRFEGTDIRTGAYRGMYLGGDEALVSREWMESNIRRNHGSLGALYPPNTWTEPNPYGAIKEGDTPSWFYFLPNGLSDPDHPDWGGWGGRFAKNEQGIWRDAIDTVGETKDARATVWRWREGYQNDFQARLDWGVAESYDDANHPPKIVLEGDASREPLRVDAKPGAHVNLSAEESSDPDGDELSFTWYVYGEASHYDGAIGMTGGKPRDCNLEFPDLDQTGSVHLVLEVRDDGEPPLTSYRRAIVTVRAE